MDDYEAWIIDASMPSPPGLLCFCPVEMKDGEVTSILTGLNFISDRPPNGMRCIGAVHDAGQEAVEAWCEANREAYERACKPHQTGGSK